MYYDAENLFFEDKSVDTTITSDVIDLGSKGPFVHPLYVVIKLTTKMTSGTMDTFTLQADSTAAFSSAKTLTTVTVPSSITQTAGPAQLAVLYAPITPGYRYLRLVGAGTTPVGGKITAFLANGVKVDL